MGQPRQPPVGHCGYREGEIVAEFSTEVEVPQKRAQRRDQRLCSPCPTLAGSLQKKILLVAAADGAIMAGPVGTTPPMVDGG
jgi:hypothetical protein